MAYKITLRIGSNCEEVICEVLHPLNSTVSVEGLPSVGLPYCLLPPGGAVSHLIPLPPEGTAYTVWPENSGSRWH